MDYLSNLTLSHEYIKEIRLFNAYNDVKNIKIFLVYNFKCLQESIKNFVFSSIFLTIGMLLEVSSFVYVVDGIRNNML